MLSQILAVILLLVGIVGIVVAVAGAVVSYQAVDSVVDGVDSLGNAFDQTLEFVSEGLDTVSGTEVGATLGGRVDEINATVDQTQVNLNNQLRTVRARPAPYFPLVWSDSIAAALHRRRSACRW